MRCAALRQVQDKEKGKGKVISISFLFPAFDEFHLNRFQICTSQIKRRISRLSFLSS